MSTVAAFLIGAVAFEHASFLVMEVFLWTTPRVQKAFNLTPEFAAQSRAMAANQGVYNGFLAAGLTWSLLADAELGFDLGVFFLVCVIVAGVFGAITVVRRIFWIQAFPALLALLALLLARQG